MNQQFNKIDGILNIALILTLLPIFAYANPIPMGKAAASFIALFFFLALMAEVAVTMLLLKKYLLKLFRLGLVYLGVNLGSIILFLFWILPAFRRQAWFFPFPEVGAELFVVLLETALLLMLVNINWFRNEESGEVSPQSALIAVATGNVASVLFGFLLLLLPLLH